MNIQPDAATLSIAGRLKEARQRKFKTAAAAARALGINEVTLRAHESGQNGIPADVGLTYCRAYSITFDWLLRGKNIQSLSVDKLSGMRLHVLGDLKIGQYIDRETETPFTPSIEIPGASVHFQIETFYVASDDWAPVYPKGTYVIGNRAEYLALRTGEHVVVERKRAGLFEMSIWELHAEQGGEGPVTLRSLTTDARIELADGGTGEYTIRTLITESYRPRNRPATERTITSKLPLAISDLEPLGE